MAHPEPMRLLLALAGVFLAGCTTYSTILVDNAGHFYRCASWGNGLVGVFQAKRIHDQCVSDMERIGYRVVTPTPNVAPPSTQSIN